MLKDILLPDLGEGIEEGTIIHIFVSPGQTIEKNEPILEIETDKATVEVPSLEEGIIEEVLINQGTAVTSGQLILKMVVQPSDQQALQKSSDEDTIDIKKNSLNDDIPPVTNPPGLPDSPNLDTIKQLDVLPVQEMTKDSDNELIHALPLTKRFAREIGVDLSKVNASGTCGKITLQDVKAFSKQKHKQTQPDNTVSITSHPLPSFEKFGQVEYKPMSRFQEANSRGMSNSWQNIPHVTIFNKAHITELETLRQELKSAVAERGISLTITSMLVKVLVMALKKFPEFNVSMDREKGRLIQKHYFNIGLAIDSPAGLIVPVIHDADTKQIVVLSQTIQDFILKAQERKLSPNDLQGGCITLSNLGKIKNTGFTPIINWPEVAILGVSPATIEPVYVNETFSPHLMLPLSLSFDHRVVDGVLGATFLQYIVELLETPLSLIL